MTISLLGSSIAGSTDGIAPAGDYGVFNPAAEECEMAIDITISAGSRRLLFASAHARGNADEAEIQWVRIYQDYVDPDDRGTLLKTLTEILDVDADSILHAEYHALLEDDMPANGTYKLVVNAQVSANEGAFQLALGWALFDNVQQTYSPLTNSEVYPPGTQGDIDQDITVPGGGLIVDNWSGDGVIDVKSETDQTRTGRFLNRGGDGGSPQSILGARAAYTLVADADTYTFGYDTGNHNRDALGIVFWQEESSLGSAPHVNVMQWGANH